MSCLISVFCKIDFPLLTVKSTIEESLYIQLLERATGDNEIVLSGENNGILVTAFKQNLLVDDSGIEFTKYNLEIDIENFHSDEPPIESGMNLAKNITEKHNCETIVVRNLQVLLQRYCPATVDQALPGDDR